jgi:signal transduction histidine kinase
MSVAAVSVADLRTLDLFDDLDEEALAPWLEAVQVRDVPAGEILVPMGTRPVGVHLLFEGEVRTTIVEGARVEPVGRMDRPTWMGAIATLTEAPMGVQVETVSPSRIGVIPADDFRRLAFAEPKIHARVMRQVAPVMSRITRIEQNRERLASLGTMAAGLAHELNNPAAAAKRAAAQMAEALDVIASTIGRFVESGMQREGAEQMVALQREAIACAKRQTALDTLDAADAEDALLERLEDLGIERADLLAEPLACAGLDDDWLDRVHAAAGPATDAAVRWVAATLTAQALAGELQESTDRMSKLVAAVKTYAYMDRGALVEVDLHEGLETTLAVLGHKLKHTSITVVRDYDRTLPRMTVRGSELNQVWTNLLDNAIDALGEHGTITIATRPDGACARVDITDDGPGIAPENLDRVFDDFFTTKDVGAGTGLGLATARRIVVDRHGGSLTVDSTTSPPTHTTFHVWIPFHQE